MRESIISICLLLLTVSAPPLCARCPGLVVPEDGEAVFGFPHFQWEQLAEAKPDAMSGYEIQIAGDTRRRAVMKAFPAVATDVSTPKRDTAPDKPSGDASPFHRLEISPGHSTILAD